MHAGGVHRTDAGACLQGMLRVYCSLRERGCRVVRLQIHVLLEFGERSGAHSQYALAEWSQRDGLVGWLPLPSAAPFMKPPTHQSQSTHNNHRRTEKFAVGTDEMIENRKEKEGDTLQFSRAVSSRSFTVLRPALYVGLRRRFLCPPGHNQRSRNVLAVRLRFLFVHTRIRHFQGMAATVRLRRSLGDRVRSCGSWKEKTLVRVVANHRRQRRACGKLCAVPRRR